MSLYGSELGIMEGAILLIILLAFYMVPTIVGVSLKHQHIAGIVILNILLGWTGFGWIGALIWAVIPTNPKREVIYVKESEK